MVTGVVVPIIAAMIAAIPVWIGVIQPWLDDDNDEPNPGPEATATDTAGGAGSDIPSDAAISAAVLEPEDLPPDYVVATAIVEEPCGLHFTRQGATGRTRALEYGPERDPYIYHEVGAYFPGEASTAMDEAIAIIDACPTTLATSYEGDRVESTITPLIYRQLGDQSYAFRQVVPGETLTYTIDTVWARVGQFVSILVVTTNREADTGFDDFVDTLANIAEAKLFTLASSP
jgi:hypothetical protein